ncbi:eukaryotic translation initiation factor NCBP-like isoform X2 [Brassica napus]|uniref:eukaryotic translation initiation factor NCBP-like isoform X2 n=1 Tax=Brassica napus TaxID=3708 RepID=UPI0006AAB205|nr:eukaryotic translation initiation factor NCBP-like isoform X2 [Brassica napus]
MEITERRHDEIMDNVKSQYVSDERHSRARAQSCTGLRFGKGSGTRHLTKISLRRLLNSARLKGFGPATVTLLVLLYCLVQVISISSRMAFAPCGRMVPTANGGKWIIRFSKGVSSRFWEDLLLALVGDQLDDADNICGAVLRTSLVCGIAMLFIIRNTWLRG